MPNGIHFLSWEDPNVQMNLQYYNWQKSALGMNLGLGSAFSNPLSPFAPRKRSPDGNQSRNLQPRVTSFQNQIDLEGVIPRVYGYKYRMYPSYAALPYTLIAGQTQYLHAAFIIGWGPLSISDLMIGDTPIADFGSDIEYEIRGGNPGDAPSTLFTQDINEEQPNAEIVFGSKISSNLGLCNSCLIDVVFPNGLFNISTGTRPDGSTYTITSARTVNLHIEVYVETVGTVVIDGPYTITENHQGPFVRTISLPLPSLGRYIVAIERAQAAGNQTTQIDAMQCVSVKGVKYGSPINPQLDASGAVKPVAYVYLRAKGSAKTQGALDAFNCRVSSNLKTWNGAAWVDTVTSAPAYVIADLLCGSVNPRPIPRARLNGAAFAAAAAFSDGKAFGFNYIYDQEGTIEEAILQAAFAGRCLYIPRDDTGKHSVVVEEARSTISQFITPLNSRGFKWTKTWGDIPHAIKAQWVSSESNFKSDETIIPRPGYTQNSATTFESQQFLGVTNHNQVYKLGLYQWACALNRPTIYEFEMPAEQLLARIGQRVKVTNDIIGYGLGEGRVTAVTLDGGGNCTAINVSEAFDMGSEKDYAIRIRFNDGTSIYQQIVTNPGSQKTLTFVTAIPAANPHPQKDDLVQYSYLNAEADMIITGIEQGEDLTARIMCVDYSPEVYTADSGTIPTYKPPVSIPEQNAIYIPPEPSFIGIASNENVMVQYGNSLILRILVSFQPPPTHLVEFIQYKYKRSDQTEFGPPQMVRADAGAFYILGIQEGELYSVQIRSVATNNMTSRWIEEQHVVVGKTSLPADVTSIFLRPDQVHIEYTPPIDFSHFQVRTAQGAAVPWTLASVALDRLVSFAFPRTILPVGTITLLIKAVDTSGNESANALSVTYEFRDDEPLNLIKESVGPGASVNLGEYPVGGQSLLNFYIDHYRLIPYNGLSLFWVSPAANFWHSNTAASFYGSGYPECWWGRRVAAVDGVSGEWYIEFDPVFTGSYCVLEYSEEGASIFWSITSSSLFWSATSSDLFYVQDSAPWRLYTEPLRGERKSYYFRGRLLPGAETLPFIEYLTYRILKPDLEETLSGVVISADGDKLALTKQFNKITSVFVNVQGDSGYPTAFQAMTVEDLPFEVNGFVGPTVKVFDTAGAPVAGKVLAIIKGY